MPEAPVKFTSSYHGFDRSRWHPCTNLWVDGNRWRYSPARRLGHPDWRIACTPARTDHWYRTRGERRAKKPDLPNDVSLAMYNSCSKHKPSGPGWSLCS